MLRRVRGFFDRRGFIEVMTPILSADTIVDRHVEPLRVVDETLPMPGHTGYLQTSPEFAMKRLLLTGIPAIYQITHAFRKGDRGDLHNVEFTMLEYYRIGDGYEDGIQLLGDFIGAQLSDNSIIRAPFAQPFMEYTGLCPHRASHEKFQHYADRSGVVYPESYRDPAVTCRDDWIDLIFSEHVQPHLGFDAPLILYDYPSGQSQLAQSRQVGDYEVTERFELYVRGVELANGYNELLDAATLQRRIRGTNDARARLGKSRLPEESRLLAAMNTGLPPYSGTAFGLDRLLMLLTGAKKIDEVLPFPIEKA